LQAGAERAVVTGPGNEVAWLRRPDRPDPVLSGGRHRRALFARPRRGARPGGIRPDADGADGRECQLSMPSFTG
jgi:hypothetical protein